VIETAFSISKQHSSLAGHFPGNPVVPGVVILDEVIQAIKKQMPGFQIAGFPIVKFLSPLEADIQVRVNVIPKQESLLEFTCHAGNRKICHGQIRFQT
jgi:3-hydroxymyristoyl/3-hydroxydecanoyl-(acyl carrier protein) dehydratase